MFRAWLHTILSARYPGVSFDVLIPPDSIMGDYSLNIAFGLAKREKNPSAGGPREIAQTICDELLSAGGEMIEKCEVAGPGFVNIFLRDTYLNDQIGKNAIPDEGSGKRVVVEYSSPNIAKPMHIGHLRSTIIGDALANVYAALGFDVVRWNFIGDWGTQFGKLIAAYKRWGDDAGLRKNPIQELLRLYVKFHNELASDPGLEGEGQSEFQKLEEGDSENREIWKRFRELSLGEFDRMYQRLDVGMAQAIIRGESDYEPQLKPLIERLIASGLAKESEGALIVDVGDEHLPPALLRKSDGATLYLTRDLASMEDRIKNLHPTPAKILYVVANQQALHFEQLFAVKDKMDLGSTETVHVKFGMVLGEDGKKLATREGKVIPLEDVINESVRRVGAVVKAKNQELPSDELASIAEAIGVGALKYNDLRQHPYSDITFSWDSMLDLGGNSGPYLQYTYARLASILRKAGDWQSSIGAYQLSHPAERALMRQLLDFGYAVQQCAHQYALNGLALYLYELANLANRYYEEVRINDDDSSADAPQRKAARLALITAVARTLKQGLELLGIKALERI